MLTDLELMKNHVNHLLRSRGNLFCGVILLDNIENLLGFLQSKTNLTLNALQAKLFIESHQSATDHLLAQKLHVMPGSRRFPKRTDCVSGKPADFLSKELR